MKTTLDAAGQIRIPEEIRQVDNLSAGDSFQLERLTAGHYLLARQNTEAFGFAIATHEDGLPLIRGEGGVITSALVREIDSQMP